MSKNLQNVCFLTLVKLRKDGKSTSYSCLNKSSVTPFPELIVFLLFYCFAFYTFLYTLNLPLKYLKVQEAGHRFPFSSKHKDESHKNMEM